MSIYLYLAIMGVGGREGGVKGKGKGKEKETMGCVRCRDSCGRR